MNPATGQQLDAAREISALSTTVKALVQGVEDISRRMDVMHSMSRDIARLQEQQTENSQAIKRAFDRMEKQDAQDETRMQTVLATKDTAERWINRGIGAWVVGSILVAVIQALVLDRVKTYETSQRVLSETLVTLDRRMGWVEYEMKRYHAREPK